LFTSRGVPAYLRSDNGPEFTAHRVRQWLAQLGVGTLFIEPGSPWEERLPGVFPWQAARRVAQRGRFRHLVRGAGPGGAPVKTLQHGETAQLPGLLPSSAGGDSVGPAGPGSNGGSLTLSVVPRMGAGQIISGGNQFLLNQLR
jgi:hypothetical protein